MSDTVCFVTCLRAELMLELRAAKSSAFKSVLHKKRAKLETLYFLKGLPFLCK